MLLTLALWLSIVQAADVGATSSADVSWNDLSLTSVAGTPVDPKTLNGKVVLVVNVASKCGFTSQYDGLQALYEAKKDEGLEIVGVPSNQFGSQEPGKNAEIAKFCRMNYGVTFTMLEKQHVNGDRRSDLYQQLVGSVAGANKPIQWNFEKFLVGRNGQVVERFGSSTKPNSAGIRAALDTAIAASAATDGSQ